MKLLDSYFLPKTKIPEGLKLSGIELWVRSIQMQCFFDEIFVGGTHISTPKPILGNVRNTISLQRNNSFQITFWQFHRDRKKIM